ncbi:hypothetical protein DSO57_1013431 [Entomophthora muscae]|uniref:Uncharacterized protein n=1 Tax=Entomophthora muscae TaxID=34485 RepID=A0ACC2TSP7_9FUNG|nr:hypothetical protein DSO57_1013431 [Entomophthora muscae]
MLVPLIKFVVYTLAPALVLIWCTTPDLWGCISHHIHHVGANLDQYMHLLENIPRRAQDIFATSENVVRSLTCDNLKLSALNSFPPMTPSPASFPSPLLETPVLQTPEEGLGGQELAPKRAPWLLGGMLLMGLDSYFPRLSATSSLWTPLGAAIPVLHWVVSWWVLSPGWEPSLVSLAPSLTAGAALETFLGVLGIPAWYQSSFPLGTGSQESCCAVFLCTGRASHDARL